MQWPIPCVQFRPLPLGLTNHVPSWFPSSSMYLILYLECLFLFLFVTPICSAGLYKFFSKLWLMWRTVREMSSIPISTLCSLLNISVNFSGEAVCSCLKPVGARFPRINVWQNKLKSWGSYAVFFREIGFKYIFVCSWFIYLAQSSC